MRRSSPAAGRTRGRSPHVLALLAGLAFGLALAASAEPLHPPGKRDIYERVLTQPGVRLSRSPGAPGQEMVKALSRLYVFARTRSGGRDWLRVGGGIHDESILGWLPADATIPWKQQLTLAFTNRAAGRERVLFLRSWDDLRGVLDSPAPAQAADGILRTVDAGRPDPRVLAVEPANFIDIAKRFYLLPILDFSEYRAPAGDKVRALKVASVTLPETASAPGAPVGAVAPIPDYRAAVVFVVDSTISMGPYIERTRAAVARFYERIREAGLLDRVAFGLVAFRAPVADPARGRDLEFVARTYVNPAEVRGGQDFLSRVKDLGEARVSTDRFDEDPYAGIKAALDAPGWRERFAERHLVLITDAGALDGSQRDPAGRPLESQTGLDAARIRSLAAESGTSIAVLHLLTREARAQGDTEPAAGQYRILSTNPANQQTAYFPIADGGVAAFGAAVDAYAGRLIENIARYTATPAGQGARPSPGPAPGSPQVGSGSGAAPQSADQLAQIRAIVDSLGHAAQLAYLGRVQGTRAPQVFEAWIADKDFADPSKEAVEVRVLLTKNQLSDLQQALKGIVQAAESDLNEENTTRGFFDRLASIAARFSVDPQARGIDQASQLADLGLIGEYIQGLPYKSDVLTLTQDTWTRWGTMRQIEFIDRLNKKIRRYGLYYADRDQWIDLAQGGASDPAELVYPIPLADLP